MKALEPTLLPEPAEVDLEPLVRRAAAGSVEAFEAIYRAQVGRVMAICLRLCGGRRSEAEDLAQETFVRAWQKLDLYRPGTEFAAWLRRLAINVVLSSRRSARRRWRREQSLAPARPAASDPSRSLDLERAIARLPAHQRHVLVLHDVEGMQHEEIARCLGIRPGTSKARLHRARARLKQEFAR